MLSFALQRISPTRSNRIPLGRLFPNMELGLARASCLAQFVVLRRKCKRPKRIEIIGKKRAALRAALRVVPRRLFSEPSNQRLWSRRSVPFT